MTLRVSLPPSLLYHAIAVPFKISPALGGKKTQPLLEQQNGARSRPSGSKQAGNAPSLRDLTNNYMCQHFASVSNRRGSCGPRHFHPPLTLSPRAGKPRSCSPHPGIIRSSQRYPLSLQPDSVSCFVYTQAKANLGFKNQKARNTAAGNKGLKELPANPSCVQKPKHYLKIRRCWQSQKVGSLRA